ncbi:TetR family transcriptional regulator [Novosphingobium sp. PhB165]|uniref:TetR/AcrR family transcriptional regulator n=1 Tax=Novosphingobium sp. PhB165 TaxID=2485105 RepID=UPI0010492D65|nr:TetR/AcrR family transcriptional regulator [Novosphingobium sp. PhB165]TCM20385.1 TetR family transcriptional regulator [Novosphingobium sp. PhB165]
MEKKSDRKVVRVDGGVRRVQIMDEAQRLIGERGYNGFSIQELADRCSLTKAGLLHHFSSKEQILIDLLDDRTKRHQLDMKNWVARRKAATVGWYDRATFIESLKKSVEREIADVEMVRMHVMLQAETLCASHPAHNYFNTREAMRQRRMALALEHFCQDPQTTARHLLALMDGLTAQWLREHMNFDLAAQFAAAISLQLPQPDDEN